MLRRLTTCTAELAIYQDTDVEDGENIKSIAKEAGLEKTRFFLNPAQWGFLGFFGFFGFFGVFGVFRVFWGFFAQKRGFLGFFQFHEYFWVHAFLLTLFPLSSPFPTTRKGLFVNKFFNAFSHSNYLFHYISRDNIIILCITGGQ
jgi:hypothetical protein